MIELFEETFYLLKKPPDVVCVSIGPVFFPFVCSGFNCMFVRSLKKAIYGEVWDALEVSKKNKLRAHDCFTCGQLLLVVYPHRCRCYLS